MDTVASEIALVCLSELLGELNLSSSFATDPFFSSRGSLSSNENRHSRPSVSLQPPKLTQRSIVLLRALVQCYIIAFVESPGSPIPDLKQLPGAHEDYSHTLQSLSEFNHQHPSSVWSLGSRVADRLLGLLSRQNGDPRVRSETTLEECVKLHLLLLLGLASSKPASDHFLRDVANASPTGQEQLDWPIHTARRIMSSSSRLSSGTTSPDGLSKPMPLPPRLRRQRTSSTSSTLSSLTGSIRRLSLSSVHPNLPSTSTTLKAPISPAVECISNEDPPLGSFGPTSSAEHHLRYIIGEAPRNPAVGRSRTRKPSLQKLFIPVQDQALLSPPPKTLKTRKRNQLHQTQHSVPSISRSVWLSTSDIPPISPTTPLSPTSSSSPTLPLSRPHSHFRTSINSNSNSDSRPFPKLDSRLAALEDASKLRSRVICAVCNKEGSDYPRCPRCSVAWCSRQCRMSGNANDMKRHECHRTQVVVR